MINSPEDLRSGGELPIGPVSAWPRERNVTSGKKIEPSEWAKMQEEGKRKFRARKAEMAKGLLKTAGQAIRHGKVSTEIREERYNTCKACPLFDPKSKRCTDCGCFMEAKTWVGGDPDMLCPKQKWER